MLTMEILTSVATLLLFCCYTVIYCYPSRPLNERSTDLAWQAWLLVDDQQNQHKQTLSDNFPRRRITPKSVFIAPTFSPESLPACADGYRPDSMGRCIKIIKLDEDAHLEFLLEKLNAQFGDYDGVEDESSSSQENVAASGPFQLNIPLNGPQEGPTKELDVAIVVAPTNSNFAAKTTAETITTNNMLGNSNVDKIPPPHDDKTPHVEESNNPKRRTESILPTTEKYSEIATIIENVTPETASSSYKTLSMSQGTTESISTSTSSELTTPSSTEETTISDQHALFFLQPPLSNTEHVLNNNGTRNANDTPLVTSYDDNNKASSNNSLTTFLSNSTFVIDASININNQIPSLNTQHPEPTESVGLDAITASSLIRFPQDDETMSPVDHVKFPEQITKIRILPQLRPNITSEQKKTQTDSLRHPLYQTVFKGYLNPDGSSTLKGNEHFIFKDVTNLPSSLVSDPLNGNHNLHTNYNQVFNHRNRDKNSNLWSVPPSWSESSPKPIVLRFSRRASNSRHLLSEQFQPQTQNSEAYYREVPSEEFSYIFGRNKNYNYKQNPR